MNENREQFPQVNKHFEVDFDLKNQLGAIRKWLLIGTNDNGNDGDYDDHDDNDDDNDEHRLLL